MELRLIQCEVGKFNLLGSEKSLSFSMGLYENNTLIKEGDTRARIYYSGEPDEKDDFNNPFDNLEEIFSKCYNYGTRVISSTDYVAECMLFAKLYSQNYEAIDAALVEKHKNRVQEQITRLQKELEWNTIVPDIYYTVNECIDKEIKKYTKWAASSEKDLLELKEESEKYAKIKLDIERYKEKIIQLEANKIVPIEGH